MLRPKYQLNHLTIRFSLQLNHLTIQFSLSSHKQLEIQNLQIIGNQIIRSVQGPVVGALLWGLMINKDLFEKHSWKINKFKLALIRSIKWIQASVQ